MAISVWPGTKTGLQPRWCQDLLGRVGGRTIDERGIVRNGKYPKLGILGEEILRKAMLDITLLRGFNRAR